MHDDPRNPNLDKKGKGKGMEQGKYNKEDATKFRSSLNNSDS